MAKAKAKAKGQKVDERLLRAAAAEGYEKLLVRTQIATQRLFNRTDAEVALAFLRIAPIEGTDEEWTAVEQMVRRVMAAFARDARDIMSLTAAERAGFTALPNGLFDAPATTALEIYEIVIVDGEIDMAASAAVRYCVDMARRCFGDAKAAPELFDRVYGEAI